MALVDITDKDFEEKVLKADGLVLVDFWAPWCGPCKMAEPVLDELAKEYKGKVSLVKINVDENPESAQKYSVMSIPTTILFGSGDEKGRKVGFAGKSGFEDLIKNGA